MNSKTQYIYAPVSGKASDSTVSFGKPKSMQIVKESQQKEEKDKDDIQKLKTVGDKRSLFIKTTRAKFGMTQDEFAKYIGIAKNIISLYENSSSVFNPTEWDKIIRGIDQLNKTKNKN
jgi:DNA-binding transcriptional regulator YiaG